VGRRAPGHHGARVPVHVHPLRPNTNTSGGSIIFYLEAQAGYVRQAWRGPARPARAAIDVRPEVEAASDARLQAPVRRHAWTRAIVYRNGDGRIIANWPGYMREYAADPHPGPRRVSADPPGRGGEPGPGNNSGGRPGS